MKILVINAGSSSMKYQLIDMDGEIVVACGMGSIALCTVLPEGKGRMAAADFIRGRKITAGDILS